MRKKPFFLGLMFCSVFASYAFFVLPTHAGFTRPIVFPVDGPYTFTDDFGDGRSGGRVHLGNDIVAAKFTPVLAVTNGDITYAPMNEPSYGYYLTLRDSEGYSYHYLHLNNDNPGTDDGNGGPSHAYAPGITRGSEVKAGQLIAWVGDSGNAESVGAHLHFELHTPDGTPIDPYESLLAASKPPAPVKTIREIPNGILIKYPNDPRVYLLANDTKYLIVDEATFAALGYSYTSIKTIPETQAYRSGIPIQAGPNIVLQRNGQTITGVPTTTTTHMIFTSTLTIGSKGAEVVQLQSVLKRLGYYTYPTITGYYGTITRDAVIKLQKAYNIEPVGFVGPKTRAVLNSV